VSFNAAIFDVDGTLVRANAIDHYLFLIRHLFPDFKKYLKLSRVFLKAPYWFFLDRISRPHFDVSFYSEYEGFPVSEVRNLAEKYFENSLKNLLLKTLLERLKNHRERGHRIILASGSPDFIVKPLARYLQTDEFLCPALIESDGVFSGKLEYLPLSAELKARSVADYALKEKIDLSQSYAYADSYSDLPLLKLVGNSTAVNPGRRLRLVAELNGWEIIKN
jgi:fatty acyl-CoA reductase